MDRSIAERLAMLRKHAGMSQEGLAVQLGISRQAISRWERGEVYPDTENLIALARLYGVSVDGLLGMSDGPCATANNEDVADAGAHRRRAIVAGGAIFFIVVVIGALALFFPRERSFTGYIQGTVVEAANYRTEIVLRLDKRPGAEGPHFVVCDLSNASVNPKDASVKEGDEITVSYQFSSADSVNGEELPGRITAETVTLNASESEG